MPHSVYVTTGVWWSIKECKNFSMEISLNAACLLLSIMIISSEYAMSSVTMTQSNSEVIIEGTTHMTCATSLPNEVHWRHLPAGGPAHEPKEVYAFGKMRSPYKDRFEIQINRTMGLYRLVISRVELTDAGIYTCQEDEGIGNFSQAQLTVLEAGPVCSSTQNPIELIGPNSCNKKQEDLVLACSVAYRGNSPPLLEWKMVGAIDTVTQGLTVEEMGNRITCHLTMSSQLSIDGSSFVCQTRKTQYNCTSGVINITYAVSSDFTRKALIGDTVVCSANTSESCSYRWKWFKGDDVLTASNSRTLIPEKSGNFRCEADCIIRNESCTITAGFAYVEDGNATSTTGETSGTLLIAFVVVTSIIIAAIISIIAFVLRTRNKNLAKRNQHAGTGSTGVVRSISIAAGAVFAILCFITVFTVGIRRLIRRVYRDEVPQNDVTADLEKSVHHLSYYESTDYIGIQVNIESACLEGDIHVPSLCEQQETPTDFDNIAQRPEENQNPPSDQDRTGYATLVDRSTPPHAVYENLKVEELTAQEPNSHTSENTPDKTSSIARNVGFHENLDNETYVNANQINLVVSK